MQGCPLGSIRKTAPALRARSFAPWATSMIHHTCRLHANISQKDRSLYPCWRPECAKRPNCSTSSQLARHTGRSHASSGWPQVQDFWYQKIWAPQFLQDHCFSCAASHSCLPFSLIYSRFGSMVE